MQPGPANHETTVRSPPIPSDSLEQSAVALKRDADDPGRDNQRADAGERVGSGSEDRAINERLQEHAAHVDDWEYAPVARELSTWYRRFSTEFLGDKVPPAAVSIEPARVDCLGWYLPERRDGLGLRFRININSRHINRPRALVLGVLLHEALHLWEEVVCQRRGARGGYHTVRFQKKATALGIPTCRNGIWRGITEGSPFADLLCRHGVAIADELKATASANDPVPRVVASGPGSRLAKWDCGCTKVWASSGVSVTANCTDCGRPFVRHAPGAGR